MSSKRMPNSRQLLTIAAGLVGVIIIVALIMIFGPGASNKDTADSANSQQSAAEAPTPAVTDPGNQQAQPSSATTITIGADGFSPASLTVARGTTVTWRNSDSKPHAVDPATGDDGPHSPQLNPNATFSYSFQKEGSFTYIDPINPSHSGKVEVKNVD